MQILIAIALPFCIAWAFAALDDLQTRQQWARWEADERACHEESTVRD